MQNIPLKANCKWKNCFSPFLCRKRNASSAWSAAWGLHARGAELAMIAQYLGVSAASYSLSDLGPLTNGLSRR